ncbi:dnaJ-like protein subfamily C member 2 [Iris pallida]|uniref:DnaJ-like protein subfamily C member 2 n=1 Tax=Iris pallida TaxID=29817 RepID=A0AAX6H2W3_IRIPA|nr:dnaJ-like protein subfamily C member 2 [Iris pallida]
MAAKRITLLITYSPDILNGDCILVSSNCFPVKASKFEPAGHAFHDAALKLAGYFEEEDADTDDQSVKSEDKGHSYMPSSDSYSTKGKKKSGDGSKQQDHYALLGLGHLRFLATEEQIRKSYRETALKHHPDKQAALLLAEETEEAKQAKKDEIESHFKSIQEAYEVLMDPVKRRVYDSTDEFDDEIPTDCAPQDFFKVFGPAFMRNGRWSVNLPVPSLGDDKTTLAEVDSFYNFWYSFKSWREFPHADEFELEQAESRDHKRWMERQNAKLREKARKEEHVRIRALIDNAYKKDPRILRRKDEERAEKQRRKEAKVLAKKLQEEEAARAAEQEKRKKEEDDKRHAEAALNQKKQREKDKKLLRKERTRLRTLSSPVVSTTSFEVSDDDVEKLCMSLDLEKLRCLCDDMEKKEGSEREQLLKDALGRGNANAAATKPEERKSQANGSESPGSKVNGVVGNVKKASPLSSYEKKEKPWGKEEIEMLRKGMQKYPKGTSRRWEVISEYIGTGRSVEEILKATKTVLLQKPDSAKAFDSFLEKRKPAPSISSPLTTRMESEGIPVTGVQDASPEAETTKKQASSSDVTTTSSAGEAAVLTNGVSSGADQDAWSAIQERALIQALKTFPKETPQRWERVATAVPGKTVNQCKKKFTLMKESFRSKKSAD